MMESETLSLSWPGWPTGARACAERAIERHGGWRRWNAVETVSFSIRALSGLIPTLKGIGRSFPMASRVCLTPHAQRAVFEDYPSRGERIEFESGALRHVDGSGAVVFMDANLRRKFRGLGKSRRWSAADAAYFFGYALTYYQGAPFLLSRTSFVRYQPSAWRGCSALTIEFPDDVVTHCRRQRFFFDPDGRIARHDYVVDIIGAWARGCHLWSDYDETSGILVARTRHVQPSVFGRPGPGVALHGELTDIDVRFRDGAAT